MAVDYIRYDILTQEAMRGIVRAVLKDAAARGLLGEHHFFISFDTRAPAVQISPRLRAQYAEEMTIILQHQFWDLTVSDDAFEVGLSFNGIPERLFVPFSAIKSFVDPAVKFAVQFAQVADESAGADTLDAAFAAAPGSAKESEAAPRDAGALPAPVPAAPPSEADKPAGSGEVVRLDRFRKK